MTSRTGSRKRAFTLVEVMVATSILALGAALLYQSFFLSLDTFDYCADYLRVAPFAEEKVWEMQDELTRRGDSANIEPSGEFVIHDKSFSWEGSYDSLDTKSGLYRTDFFVLRQKNRKAMRLSRTAYATFKQ